MSEVSESKTHSAQYRPRIADAALSDRLQSVPTVVIEGVRACGKTATALEQSASDVLFDIDPNAVDIARVNPELLLDGAEPRLLDEWHLAPEVWNHVRRASDAGRRPGRFILTGSALPSDDISRHTGAGRISRILMRPMSLFESGLSSGAVSLGGLLDSEPVGAPPAPASLTDLVEATCRGGWPSTLDIDLRRAQQFVRDHLDETRRADVRLGPGRRRDPVRLRQLMQSLARNTATDAALATLASDAGGGQPLDPATVRGYLDDLERVFIVEDQPAWSVHLRSRSRLHSAPKRHFVDPSLAVAALRTGPTRLLAGLGFFGLLFESLVVRDLRVYASAHDGEVFHYRDNTGLEADAIIETGAGTWVGVEAKLGGADAVDAAAGSLLKLRDRVDTSVAGEPAKLVVITATGYAFERDDGVAVVPITTLGP
ncbi:ATP-binding protein [Candidatus Poriferisodalis sp.]|uniref:ATP-binding protein n=1 Tax=Candidatus Poriferisodalis sp. TaxID=3101277 RepID=UPI003AF622D1